MSHVEREPCILHDPTGIGSFGFALWRQGHVVPASKEVQLVPRTLAVAEENEFSKHGDIVGREGKGKEFSGLENVESTRIKFSVTEVVTVPPEPYSDHIYPRRPRPRLGEPPWQKQ